MVAIKHPFSTLLCNGSSWSTWLDWEHLGGLVKHSFGVPMVSFQRPLTEELFKRESDKKHPLRTFIFVTVSNSRLCHKSKSEEAEGGLQWWNINRAKWVTTEKISIKFKPCVSLDTTSSSINHMKFLLTRMVLFIWADILGTTDRTELMALTPCLHLDVLLLRKLPQLSASSSTFLHPSETAYRLSTLVKNSSLRSFSA